MNLKAKLAKIEEFNFKPGERICGRFQIVQKLGGGLEGEVYKVIEELTKTNRAIKLFYPHQNPKRKISIRYATKLEKLRDTGVVMDYLSHETINYKRQKVAVIVSEFINGETLYDFVMRQRGKRLTVLPALHLLYSIVKGVESIHVNGEYHGDLHLDNILIMKFGLEFKIKIIDLHHWGDSKKDNRDEDIIKLIRVFYDVLGGVKYYKNLSPSIKDIICGLKRNLILKKFKTMTALRLHLENMDCSDAL